MRTVIDGDVLKMNMRESNLKRWFVAALTLAGVGYTLAAFEAKPASSIIEVFAIVFGIVGSLVVVGFYFVMFWEGMHTRRGVAKAKLIAFFLVFPIGSAFIYFWWTRYIRPSKPSQTNG